MTFPVAQWLLDVQSTLSKIGLTFPDPTTLDTEPSVEQLGPDLLTSYNVTYKSQQHTEDYS